MSIHRLTLRNHGVHRGASVLENPSCAATDSGHSLQGDLDCISPSRMSDYDHLNFGFRINEADSFSEQQGLKIILDNWPTEANTRLLRKALDFKIVGRKKCLSLERGDRLADLAFSWLRLHDARFTYLDMFKDAEGLESGIAQMGMKIQCFHDNLAYFAGSRKPSHLVQTLIRVHEIFVCLRKCKYEEWSLYTSISTIWWFMDQANLTNSQFHHSNHAST